MLCLDISKKDESDFRKEIGERLGNKKGNLTKATEAAIQMWIQSFQNGYELGYSAVMREMETCRIHSQGNK
jgi:hypothetical protein